MAEYRFHIPDMDCAEEVRVLRATLSGKPGVRDLRFDLVGRLLTVVTGEPDPGAEALLRWIEPTGFRARPAAGRTAIADHPEDKRRRWATLLSGLFFLAGGAAQLALAGATGEVPGPAAFLYGLAIVIGGFHIAPRAWRAARTEIAATLARG